jgi:hypothetical protein
MITKNPQNDADVRLLLAAFPDVRSDGRLIRHEEIEAVLRIPRTSSRYHTVTWKWRRVLEDERGVYLDGRSAQGAGFIAFLPDEHVRYGAKGFHHLGRRTGRLLKIMSMPADEALSPEMRRYRQLVVSSIEQKAKENREALRDIARALAPPRTMPRRVALP